MYETILADLTQQGGATESSAQSAARFFKSGPGQYSEGDVFLGVKVPTIRLIAKKYATVNTSVIQELLNSPLHEVRLLGVIIMANRSKKGDNAVKQQMLNLYLENTAHINNWDIVDSSCHDIVGGFLLQHPEKMQLLYDLAKSNNLWERRIAMVSTWRFIREGQTDITYQIADLLLNDTHDLIHKAVGWMLREAGKRNELQLKDYLQKKHRQIPRTAFRYAIERFSPEERAYFMRLK